MKKPARLKDIASKCGVSCATVSDVLNGKSELKGIKDKTRDTILKTAELMNYKVNINARSIVTGKSNIITALMPSVENFFYGKIYASFQKFLNEKGYSVILFLSSWEQILERKFIEKTISFRAEGCLSVPRFSSEKRNDFKELISYGIPSVFFDIKPNLENIDFFHFDNRTGVFEAASELLGSGHRNIVLFIRDSSKKRGVRLENERSSGLEQAFKKYDIPFDPEKCIRRISSTIFDANDSSASGYQMTANLLKTNPETSAVICLNDEFAIGAYTAARERGLSIPEDISIIGYGNHRFAKDMFPPLTTLRHDLEEMGKALGERLFEKINNKQDGPEGRDFAMPTPLIKRKSSSIYERRAR